MSDLDEFIEAAQARCDAATPAEWKTNTYGIRDIPRALAIIRVLRNGINDARERADGGDNCLVKALEKAEAIARGEGETV